LALVHRAFEKHLLRDLSDQVLLYLFTTKNQFCAQPAKWVTMLKIQSRAMIAVLFLAALLITGVFNVIALWLMGTATSATFISLTILIAQ
jgi:hypothetical protein